VLGVWLHDVAMGRWKFEAGLLRAGRLPDRDFVAGRGYAPANAAAKEASESLKTCRARRGVGGVCSFMRRLQPRQLSCTRVDDIGMKDQLLSGSPEDLSLSGHAKGPAPVRCDTQYVPWFVSRCLDLRIARITFRTWAWF